MGISIAIDAANYDQKTQEKYCKVFERIHGIKEASDELNFFYIGRLQKLIQSYEADKHQMLQHFFGLDGYSEQDLGSLAKLTKQSFISEVILVVDGLIKDLREKRELYDARLLSIYYGRRIDKARDELIQLKNAASSKYVQLNHEILEKYNKLISETEEEIKNCQKQQETVETEYKEANKEYKKYA